MITALLLLATVFLIQARMPLAFLATWAHCWLMFSRLSTNHPQVLFRRAAFQPLLPKPAVLHGVVVTKVQDLALGLAVPHTVGLSPSIQAVQIPLQSLPPSSRSTVPPCLVSSANSLREHSIPSPRSLIKMLHKAGPNTEPWRTSLVTGHQPDLTPFTTTLCARPSRRFFTQRRVHPSKPRAASFSRRMLWETVSTALL